MDLAAFHAPGSKLSCDFQRLASVLNWGEQPQVQNALSPPEGRGGGRRQGCQVVIMVVHRVTLVNVRLYFYIIATSKTFLDTCIRCQRFQ